MENEMMMTPEQMIMMEIQKAKTMQRMGRKMYKSHLNQKMEAARSPKNFNGLEASWKNIEKDMSIKLQKGGSK